VFGLPLEFREEEVSETTLFEITLLLIGSAQKRSARVGAALL
jgi:hypothetical protein